MVSEPASGPLGSSSGPQWRRRALVFSVALIPVGLHFSPSSCRNCWLGQRDVVYSHGGASSATRRSSPPPRAAAASFASPSPSQARGSDHGCGFRSRVSPAWTDNTPRENAAFFRIQACHRRRNPRGREVWGEDRAPPASLRCGADGSDDGIMEDAAMIVASYRTIHFIGDSLLRQVYFTLLCVLNITEGDIETANDLGSRAEYKRDEKDGHSTSTTALQYKCTVFNHATHTPKAASPRDLVVVDAGLAYQAQSDKFHDLVSVARHVRDASQTTNATILWVETINSEWPTSNGDFVEQTFNRPGVRCEALTAESIRGNGNFTGPAHFLNETWRRQNLNMFGPYVEQAERNRRVADHLAPYYPPAVARGIVAAAGEDGAHCLPHCAPANWRNDVTNAILARNATGDDGRRAPAAKAVAIVPAWRQLVARGVPQHQRDGDCTHKSMEAVLAMVQQLLRVMQRQREALSST